MTVTSDDNDKPHAHGIVDNVGMAYPSLQSTGEVTQCHVSALHYCVAMLHIVCMCLPQPPVQNSKLMMKILFLAA